MQRFLAQTEAFLKANDPQVSDVYVNQLAQNFAIAFFGKQEGLQGLFADCPVEDQGGVYSVFDRGDIMRAQTELAGSGGDVAQIGFSVDNSNSYFCQPYKAEHVQTDQARAAWRLPVKADKAAADFLADAAWRTREVRWCDAFFKAGVWATDATLASTWDDPGSNLLADINTGIEKIMEATGRRPNVLGLGPKVWKAVKIHPQLVGRLPQVAGQENNMQLRKVVLRAVADFFELDEVMVGYGVRNTAAKGATATPGFIAGSHALLAYRTSQPSTQEPSAGYRFVWSAYGGPAGIQIRQGRDDRKEENWTQIRHADDNKIVASELGYFFPNAVP